MIFRHSLGSSDGIKCWSEHIAHGFIFISHRSTYAVQYITAPTAFMVQLCVLNIFLKYKAIKSCLFGRGGGDVDFKQLRT